MNFLQFTPKLELFILSDENKKTQSESTACVNQIRSSEPIEREKKSHLHFSIM